MSNPLIAPQTAEASELLPTASYPYVTVTCSNLAGAETCTIVVVDSYGAEVPAGTWDARATAMDADVGAVTIQGGPTYKITKSVTASADSSVCWSPCKMY